MPQRNQLTWGELRVGLFVLAGLTLLIVAIFYVTGFGILTPKYRLVTFLPDVSGLTVGAPVRVDGIDVGNVDNLLLNALTGAQASDQQRNIRVILRIDAKYQGAIRTDSVATTATEGLLGNGYIDISRGFTGTVLQNNQELHGEAAKGISELVNQGADLAQHLNELSDQVNGLIADVRAGKGTLGKFVTDDSAYNHIVSVSGRFDDMLADIQSGQGTLGKLYATDELYTKTTSAVGHVDNILDAIQQQKGSAGKFIYDSSLHDNANQFITKSNSLLDDVKAGKGTLGKLTTDDSLFSTWKQAGTNVSTATSKFNSNDSTIGKFFNDPQLYDNLTGMTADARLLLNDFRQNPKKFLRVKFSLF